MSNYTKEMAAKMIASAPITLAVAKQLAADFSLPQSSIIAKAVTLKLYVPEAKVIKAKAAKVTKADLIQDIEERMRLPHGALGTLSKVADLKQLLTSTLSLEELS